MVNRAKYLLALFIVALPFSTRSQVQCYNDPKNHTVVVEFELPKYSKKDTLLPKPYAQTAKFSYIEVDNPSFGILDSVGYPELPQLTVDLNIPRNAQVKGLKVSDAKIEQFTVEYPIMPNQEDIRLDDTAAVHAVKINSSFYSGNNYFPRSFIGGHEEYILRDRKGVSLCITPFSFVPGKQVVRVIVAAKITVDYEIKDIGKESVDTNDLWESYYERHFCNYKALPAGGAGTSGRYLMVVCDSLKDAIEPFMAYKRNVGFSVDTIVIKAEDATPSKIKESIKQRYDNTGTRPDFVLLVGSHNLLPAYEGNLTADDKDNPITDLPYSCFAGGDLNPDVWLGRWPVSTPKEVQIITNKTIFMQANMHSFEKKALFVSGNDNRATMREEFTTTNDKVKNDSFLPGGYACLSLYQPEKSIMQSAFSETPTVFVYSGHGNIVSIGDVGVDTNSNDYVIDNEFLASVNNSVPIFSFVFACRTGNFGNGDFIGGEFISSDNGGVSYLGSSVNSKPHTDNTLERKMLGDAFFEHDYLAQIVDKGKNKFNNYFWHTKKLKRRYCKSYNLLGDPSFLVRGWGCGHDYWLSDLVLGEGDKQVYHANSYVNIVSSEIKPGARLVVTSGNEIEIGDGFEAFKGADVEFGIEPCLAPVILQSPNGGYSSSEIENEDEMAIAIEADNVAVYPSPMNEVLNIRFDVDEEAVASVMLVDVYGRTLISKAGLNLSSSGNHLQLDVSWLPSGCYFVVTKVNGNINSVCVIKQ